MLPSRALATENCTGRTVPSIDHSSAGCQPQLKENAELPRLCEEWPFLVSACKYSCIQRKQDMAFKNMYEENFRCLAFFLLYFSLLQQTRYLRNDLVLGPSQHAALTPLMDLMLWSLGLFLAPFSRSCQCLKSLLSAFIFLFSLVRFIYLNAKNKLFNKTLQLFSQNSPKLSGAFMSS